MTGFVFNSCGGSNTADAILNSFRVYTDGKGPDVDDTVDIQAFIEQNYADGVASIFPSGEYYTRGLDPDSGWEIYGMGESTIFYSAKDLPFFKSNVNQLAYRLANTHRYNVTAIADGAIFNPLSSDNTYVTKLTVTGNPIEDGLLAKARMHIMSQDVVPYTAGSSSKAYCGEDFEIADIKPNADGTGVDIFTKGRLRWHDSYTTGIVLNSFEGDRQYIMRNFKVMGKRIADAVTKAVVSARGTGYTTLPTISVDNTGTGGSGATFTCSLQLGAVTIANAGSGGTDGTFSFTLSGGGATKQGTGTFTVSGGQVTAATITNPGDRYTSMPTASLTASAGLTGASLTFTGYIGEITVGTASPSTGGTGHGTGYVTAPVLTFSGGGGSGAEGIAIVGGDCFNADYDVDTSISNTHAHALQIHYAVGAVVTDIVFDDLWEGGLEFHNSPFSLSDRIESRRLSNFKTATSVYLGRLGYTVIDYNASKNTHKFIKSNVGRHAYTTGARETTSSAAAINNIWYDIGTCCNIIIDRMVDTGGTGTVFGPHEDVNGITIGEIISTDEYQGNQDESYRGCIVQLRGHNINIGKVMGYGGSDGVRYQNTEQINSVHTIGTIQIRNLTDSTENCHAFRYPAPSGAAPTYNSEIVIAEIIAHGVGKPVRCDSGANVTIGKIMATDIRATFVDIQTGANVTIGESFSDFTDNTTPNTSRRDYNLVGTSSLRVGKHTCKLGSTKNPSVTYNISGTTATLFPGTVTIINPSGVTPPVLITNGATVTVESKGSTNVKTGLWDTNYSHTLNLVAGSNLTADRDLTIVTGDAARTLTLSGDVTLNAGTVNPLTTKGDIYTHSGTDAARLAIGADGFIPVANANSTNGLDWFDSPARLTVTSGRYIVSPNVSTVGSFTHATASMFACPVYVKKRTACTGIAFGVHASATNLNVKAAVYADSSGVPGAKVASTDITAGPFTDAADTNHAISFGAAVTFNPGWYWLVIQTDQNQALKSQSGSAQSGYAGAASMITNGTRWSATNTYASGLPSSFGSAVVTDNAGATHLGLIVQ
jgi:hypothetical protein